MKRSLPLLLILLATTFGYDQSRCYGQSRAEFAKQRDKMVEDEVAAAGITNKRVLEAIRTTPRHEFVPHPQRKRAYLDMALPIGSQQTISPPFIVAYMTEQIDPQPTDRVLEIGTGSGYQAAVLSPLVRDVYSIEIVEPLGKQADRTIKRLRYKTVITKIGDGYKGWPKYAPFDKIIVTCSPEKPPQPLVDQLKEGGLMIVPVGERFQQNLVLFRKVNGELERQVLQATLFVPMTGTAEQRREVQPDPNRPRISNGSFEQLLTNKGDREPAGWHYLRQMKVVSDSQAAPAGKYYLQFNNEEPGLGSRALQGFAIDGRSVSQVHLSFSARGSGIRFGQHPRQWPYVVVTFYDDRRNAIGEEIIGPLAGDFPWTQYKEVLSVPLKSREAIIRIGLLGAIGELALDNFRLSSPEK